MMPWDFYYKPLPQILDVLESMCVQWFSAFNAAIRKLFVATRIQNNVQSSRRLSHVRTTFLGSFG